MNKDYLTSPKIQELLETDWLSVFGYNEMELEKQGEILDKGGEMLFNLALIKALQLLNDEDLSGLDEILDAPDIDNVRLYNYFQDKIPNFEDEMKQVYAEFVERLDILRSV